MNRQTNNKPIQMGLKICRYATTVPRLALAVKAYCNYSEFRSDYITEFGAK